MWVEVLGDRALDVYDAVAREFKKMAKRGLVEILTERTSLSNDGPLIDSLRHRRVRIG